MADEQLTPSPIVSCPVCGRNRGILSYNRVGATWRICDKGCWAEWDESLRAVSAAVHWVTYDGRPETLPPAEKNGMISDVIILHRAAEIKSIAATYRIFVNCHFPGDCSTLPDNFLETGNRSQNMVWELAEEPYSKYCPEPGDRWAYLPTPPEAAEL